LAQNAAANQGTTKEKKNERIEAKLRPNPTKCGEIGGVVGGGERGGAGGRDSGSGAAGWFVYGAVWLAWAPRGGGGGGGGGWGYPSEKTRYLLKDKPKRMDDTRNDKRGGRYLLDNEKGELPDPPTS